MADFSSLALKWDPKFACFFIQKFVDSKLLLSENTSLGAVDQLRNLSTYFVEEAINPNINYQLGSIDEELLEKQWLKIVYFENGGLLPSSFLSLSKNTTKLKVRFEQIIHCNVLLLNILWYLGFLGECWHLPYV